MWIDFNFFESQGFLTSYKIKLKFNDFIVIIIKSCTYKMYNFFVNISEILLKNYHILMQNCDIYKKINFTSILY